MSNESNSIRNMVDLLHQGATLTELSCPACSSPIFRLRSGDLWCEQCKKRVVVIKEGAQPIETTAPSLLANLELTILSKIQELDLKINDAQNLDELQKIITILSTLLDTLDKVRKMKK